MKEISLNVLDIAQNSVKAGAGHIGVFLDRAGSALTVTITDDGCGMPEDFLRQVTDPFTTTRTTRKVGMGIPLFKLAAEQTGGALTIASKQASEDDPAHGTTISALFYTDHVDCAPLGDLASTMVTLLQGSPDVSWTYRYTVDGEEKQSLSTDEMKAMLGDEVPIDTPEVLAWVRESLAG